MQLPRLRTISLSHAMLTRSPVFRTRVLHGVKGFIFTAFGKDDEGAQALPPAILPPAQMLPDVERMELDLCAYQSAYAADFSMLLIMLSECPNLRDLQFHAFPDKFSWTIAPNVEFPALEHLDMSSRTVVPSGLRALASCKWSALVSLRLKLILYDAAILIQFLEAAPRLRSLHLHFNQGRTRMDSLMQRFTQKAWRNLWTVCFTFNYFSPDLLASMDHMRTCMPNACIHVRSSDGQAKMCIGVNRSQATICSCCQVRGS
jgi:hypothetical protein